MSKVITFARNFPTTHPMKGQPTFFVEKFWKSFSINALGETFYQCMDDDCRELNKYLPYNVLCHFLDNLNKYANSDNNIVPKNHTIREGERWKAGDWFSPRVWSARPYHSPQIIIASDIQIKRVIDICSDGVLWWLNHKPINSTTLEQIALNDGLSVIALKDWFKCKPFSGQILIWNDTNLPY